MIRHKLEENDGHEWTAPIHQANHQSADHSICVLSSVHRHRWVSRSVLHKDVRSEEHTSELQSRFDLVCRLLLEKKKKKTKKNFVIVEYETRTDIRKAT